MAEARRGVDPFEAFKAKKAEKEKQAKESAANDAAAKKAGWVEGVGPVDPNAKADPTKPKGFSRGRYAKPPVDPKELAALKPEGLEDTQLAKPKPTPIDKLPPEDKRRPKKFGRY